jgi:formylglycine-generating enzyme required for sulfatase activity
LSFEPEDAQIFFGRARATNELRELLARQESRGSAFVLVMGASGSGKSSVVKAGLLPDLVLPGMIGRVALCRWALLRPSDGGSDPLAALAAALLSSSALPELGDLQYTALSLKNQLAGNPEQLVFAVRQGLARAAEKARLTAAAEARLTLIIDQMEELFTTADVSAEQRNAFVTALEALARSGLVWVIATMRSDFFDRLETIPILSRLSEGEARYLLTPPLSAEIGQIVRQPAREAGLSFEVDSTSGLGLDEVVRQAASNNPGSLPLLSFLLDQLWQLRDTKTGMLTFATYKALGGLEGALGKCAEELFATLPVDVQRQLPSVLRRLTTVSRDGKATARAAKISDFPPNTPRRAFVEAFLNPRSRLLVAEGDVSGARLRVAHEALFSHWDRAREQIASDSRDLELQGRLEHSAERWQAAAKKDKQSLLLAAGQPLTEALVLLKNWGNDLPNEVAEFIAESRHFVRRRRMQLTAAIAGAFALLPIIIGFLWMALVWSGVRDLEKEMEFVSLPGACFMMGSPDSETERYSNEEQHQVCLKAFDIGKYDITQDEWRKIMLHRRDPSRYKNGHNPVETVTWGEAGQLARLMSLFGKYRYKLPSEAEWEYAARGGTQTARYWGDRAEDGCTYANMRDQSFYHMYPDEGGNVECNDGAIGVVSVGSFKPNPFGLYDALGNVFNWTEDCFAESYANAPRDGTAFISKDCEKRVIRGGAWYTVPRHMRSAYREAFGPETPGFIGVRLVRTAK